MNIHISSSRLNCNNVAKFLFDKHIESNVTSNKSIICTKDKSHCYLESGCAIKLHEYDPNFIKKVWPQLRKEMNLNCARIIFTYDGCINQLTNN